MHATKADWHRLGSFAVEGIPELTLAQFRIEAAKIILSMDAHRPWFLKEPRLCVLAPVWLELLEFPVCVFVHRSPLEVAISLKTRNDFPPGFSCALWEFYNTAALNATFGLRRLQVNHRDLMRDPVGTVRILLKELRRHGVRGLRAPSDDEVLAFIDPGLSRARADTTGSALTPSQQKLYEAFETGEALRLTKLINFSRKARSVLRAHDRAVDPENKIGKLEADHARLTAELLVSKEGKVDLQKALAEKNTELSALKQTKAELQKALAEKTPELSALKQAKAELQKAVAEKTSELSALKQAKAELQKALAAELSAAKQAKAELQKALAEKNEELRGTRRDLEKAQIEIKTARQIGETFRRQMNSLERALKKQLERLRETAKADATNTKIRELRDAIARRDTHIQKITRSIQETAQDFAAEKEQVQKLGQLLKKAATEIDRIRQSSRWKAGSIVLLRPRNGKKNEAFEKYLGAFEAWLEKKKKSWAQTRAAIAREPAPVAKALPRLPDLRFREFDHESIDHIVRQLGNPVSIVIPIYNGASDLERCVESVLRHTTVPFELILVDDHSPDAAIGVLLAKYEAHRAVRILRQTENRGFVRSADSGMRASVHDVVLLNSDTEVTPRWMQKLIVAAYSNPRIATVTPFSNAAGAFSVPEIGINAPIPFPFTPLKMSRLTERLSRRVYPEVPTGNGFCMFIKRQVVEEIGGFDTENFGRGYGEENDFCMRARKAGWCNVIDDSLFIYHRGNNSFGEEKQTLVAQNRLVLDRLHPDYTGLVREFTNSAQINALRARIGEGLRQGEPELHLEKRRVLYVLHEGSGGVPMTNADLVSKINDTEQCFLLTSTGTEMILREWRDDGAVERMRWNLRVSWSAENFTQPAMREIYFQVLVGLGIDLVHIRHLFKHSFDLPSLCRPLGIPVVLSFHDYYFVCPSIHLLDQNAQFCGGQCTRALNSAPFLRRC